MEGLLSIFHGISNTDLTHLPLFLKTLNEQQSFRQSATGSSEFISHITTLLSKPFTKYQGLRLLENILTQCSLDILEQKGALWANLCIKTFSQKGLEICVPFAHNSLSILIQKSPDIPELSKSFTSNILPKLFESLSNVDPSNYLSALKCVETSLRVYPGPCGIARNTIEKFILQFVDNEDEELVRWSGKCLLLLRQVRGGGASGMSSKDGWKNLQLKLLGSLHETLDYMYANCSEVHDFNIESDKLLPNAMDLSDEPIQRSTQLLTRFKNLISYLTTAITEPYPVTKAIMPKKILNLITRGLAVNCKILEKNAILDNLVIGAILPEVHIRLYNLLNALILTLKGNMALYVMTYLSFITETLKWTSSGKSVGFTKTYSSLRSTAYNSLSLWNKVLGYGSCCALIAENILEQIKGDIIPFQNEVTLKVLSGGKKHMSKKARRLLHKAQNEKSNIAQTHSKAFNPQNTKIIYSDEGNQNVCSAALECLNSIILVASTFLKPTVIKEIQIVIVSIAIDIIGCNEQKTKLYSNYECRKRLYDVLYGLAVSPNYLCPPPVELTIEILNTAQTRDKHMIVRDVCSVHLKNVEKILHPQKECLLFPPEMNDLRNALKHSNGNEDVDKEISDDSEMSDIDVGDNIPTNTILTEKHNEIHIIEDVILSGPKSDEVLPVEEIYKVQDTSDTDSIKETIVQSVVISSNENTTDTVIDISNENSVECIEDIVMGNTSVEIISASNDLMPEDSIEPLAKRQRLSSEITHQENEVISVEKEVMDGKESVLSDVDEVISVGMENTDIKNDEDLADEIAATFVNELNEML